MATTAIPLDRFRDNFVEQGGRQQIRLPNGEYQQLSVGVRTIGRRYSRGIRYIIDAVRHHILEYARVGLAHNRTALADTKKYERQLSGTPPDRADNMLASVTHNVVLEIDRAIQQRVDDTVLSGPFFKYEPPSFLPAVERNKIAKGLEKIACMQVEESSDFDRNRKQLLQAVRFYGYGHAVAEYESGIKPQTWHGLWQDMYFSKGTTLKALWPWYVLYGKWNESHWQNQPWIGYVHELNLPLIRSNHIAAILGRDEEDNEVVYPHGQYFNLQEIEEKTKHLTLSATAIGDNEREYQARISYPADTHIRRLLAWTFWTRDIWMPGIIENAKQADPALTDEEIFIELGITPNQIEHCNLWKLTSIDPTGGENIIIDPSIVCQILPTPYNHDMLPLIGAQAIQFPDRASGQGVGHLCYYMQHALDTLLSLLVHRQIMQSTDMWAIMRGALANPPEEWEWEPNRVYEINEFGPERDASKIFQRIGAELQTSVEGVNMLDMLYQRMKSVAGATEPPFGGRRTAYEISQILEVGTRGIQVEMGHNMLMALFDFAKIQLANNAQFLEPRDAIALAGAAGLDVALIDRIQTENDISFTAMPVRIKVVGKKRLVETSLQVRHLIELQMTPLKQADIEAKLRNMSLPPTLQRELIDIYQKAGVEDAEDRYFDTQDLMLSTDDVLELLRQGREVALQPNRFAGNIQIAYAELAAVRQLAKENPVAELYRQELAEYIQSLEGMSMREQMTMGAQQAGPGGGGNGSLMQAGPASMRRMLPNAVSENAFQIRSAIPTEPTPNEEMGGF